MPRVINRLTRLFPNMLFAGQSRKVQEILQSPLPALSPEEACKQDFKQMGQEIRNACKKAIAIHG